MKTNLCLKASAGLLAGCLFFSGPVPALAETGPGLTVSGTGQAFAETEQAAPGTGQACATTEQAGSVAPQTDAGTGYRQETVVRNPISIPYGDLGVERAVRHNNSVSDTFRAGLRTFSYKTAASVIQNSQGNVNYSPSSLYYALALAARGANAGTKNQLYTLLSAPGQNAEELAEECGRLYRQLYRGNEVSHVKFASSLWLMDGSPVNDTYRRIAEQQFYSDIFRINLTDPNAADLMKQWVSSQTSQTVSPQFTISQDEAMRIINTVYFNNQWVYDFDRTRTVAESFYPADGQISSCEYMTDISKCSYYRGQGFLRASLSLKENCTMIFILPDEGITPQSLVSSEAVMDEMFGSVIESYGLTAWKIPKFQIRSSLDMKPVLESLGISDAFLPGTADFTGITGDSYYLGNIIQETSIRLDENGVNVSDYVDISDIRDKTDTVIRADMTLNRPFLYAVIGSQGAPLFIGICANPGI